MHSDPDKENTMLPMPYKGSVQITEIMPLAAVFLISYTHTLYHREREGGREGEREKGLGGLSNADHLSLSLPASAPKPLPPNSWVVAMETASAPQ